jgi:RNA polymerase sigma-70 factor (ECF subfamily)
MADTSWIILRQTLLAGYADLARQLARRLGSFEQAADALQDTFLRVERGGEIGPVRNPRAYLLRMAVNIAANRRIAERRFLSTEETKALLDIPDETPSAERVVEARSDIEALKLALKTLAPRQREIFVGAWSEGLSHEALALRLGLPLRTVQRESKKAREHLLAAVMEKVGGNGRGGPRELSSLGETSRGKKDDRR